MGETPRKARRTRHCPKCRYDVQGLPYGTPCPECGQSLLVEDVAEYQRGHAPMPRGLFIGGLIACGLLWLAMAGKIASAGNQSFGTLVTGGFLSIPTIALVLLPLLLCLFAPQRVPRAVVVGAVVGSWIVGFPAAFYVMGLPIGMDSLDAVTYFTVPLAAMIPTGGMMIVGALAGWLVDAMRQRQK